MQNGQLQLTELIKEIEKYKEVSYRIVLKRTEETFVLLMALVDIHPELPVQNWSRADYGRFVFLAGRVSGADLGQWIDGCRGQAGGETFGVPEMSSTASQDRIPSHARYGGVMRLPLPHTRYQISRSNSSFRESDSEFLIGDNCPSFFNLDEAICRLLYDTEWLRGQQEVRDPLWIIRVAHPEAWIERLKLSPGSVSVTIAGTNVTDTRLEIMGAAGNGFDQKLLEAGTIECPMPHGLPSNLRVLLSRDRICLDHRDLDLQGGSPRFWDNVDTAHPTNLSEQIQGLRSQGEGETIEFKAKIPDDTDKFLKTVAAFANGRGGVILIGVDDETGLIVGVTGNVAREKDRIIDMIRNVVVPEPQLRVEVCAIESKNVIAVQVEQGDKRPYGLHPAKPVYYIRRGANSFPASQEEVRALAQSDRDSTQYSQNRFFQGQRI
jgi:schlafen family protein